MKQPLVIAAEISQIQTINNISGIFETIASMQIAKVKKQVLASKEFFAELWNMYLGLRVDPFEHGNSGFGASGATNTKELFLVITAEGGFSGDIDQRLIEFMSTKYDEKKHDIIVVGHHGATQLSQRGISFKHYFKLPGDDQDINVNPILEQIIKYPATTAFYQTYVSLALQDVKQISLQNAVQNMSTNVSEDDIITTDNYIFEPSDEEVINHLESTMLGVAVGQIILESKLAQYASRFKAMTAAHERANEMHTELKFAFSRSKRALADERSKEIITSIKLAGGAS